jgi:hypothetical protein
MSSEEDPVACSAASTVADAVLQHFVHFSGHFQTRTSFVAHHPIARAAVDGEFLTVQRQISALRFEHRHPHRYCISLRHAEMLACRGFR